MSDGRKIVIRGAILIDPATDLDRAVAEVSLREDAPADAPARTVAGVRLSCSGAAVRRVAFSFAATVVPGRDYALAAEIRRAGGARLRPGDLLTVEHRRWDPGRDRPVALKVVAID